jgi:hypothetical protein
VCACARVCVRACVRVDVCVWQGEREGEREREREREKEKKAEREGCGDDGLRYVDRQNHLAHARGRHLADCGCVWCVGVCVSGREIEGEREGGERCGRRGRLAKRVPLPPRARRASNAARCCCGLIALCSGSRRWRPREKWALPDSRSSTALISAMPFMGGGREGVRVQG